MSLRLDYHWMRIFSSFQVLDNPKFASEKAVLPLVYTDVNMEAMATDNI